MTKTLQHLHKNTNRYNTETNDHEHEPLVKNIDAINWNNNMMFGEIFQKADFFFFAEKYLFYAFHFHAI